MNREIRLNLDDYEFLEEEFIGGSILSSEEGEEHNCYNYEDFSEIEYEDNFASFRRTCSECKTVTKMVFREIRK